MKPHSLLPITAVLGALAVGLGAFGSHGLKDILSPESLDVWRTAVSYHFIHTVALLALYLHRGAGTVSAWPARLWITGILLFSGSLYLLSTRAAHGLPVAFLGPITPLGGLALTAGWLALLLPGSRKDPFPSPSTENA